MLTIYAMKNNLSNQKKPYAFHSSTCGTITAKEFVKSIAEANTTVTEADTIAVMSLIREKFNQYINQGYAVKLPMGTFRAGASGTAESEKERFRPPRPSSRKGTGTDHTISLLFEPDRAYEKWLKTSVDYKKKAKFRVCRPAIYAVYTAPARAEAKQVSPGDILIVRGEYLKMDLADQAQGVFLFPEFRRGSRVRVTRYIDNARRTVSFQIPDDMPCGLYHVHLAARVRKALQITESNQFLIAENSPESGI